MNQGTQSIITETVNIFKGKIVDVDTKSMTIEITGDDEKVSAFTELMKNYGIKELIRTGLTALER